MKNHLKNVDQLPQLELDKNRFRIKECPCGKCNKDGKFVPFKGFDDKGYCHSCGETFLPELPNTEERNTAFQTKQYYKPLPKQPKIDFIPFKTYQELLSRGVSLYARNHFIQWLGCKQRGGFAFDTLTIQTLIEKYYLGNSDLNKYEGWILLPYIDVQGRIRDIKAMDYDPSSGKRIKGPFNKVFFIGKEILNNYNANTVRCFFGEHLLKGNNKPVKIFESEATAIYAAAFFPESVCIATGGTNGCKWTEFDKCIVLKGRNITLYPDIDAQEQWEQKTNVFKEYGLNVQVSQLIKASAVRFSAQFGIDYSELEKQKFDLRDILKNKNLYNFVKSEQVIATNILSDKEPVATKICEPIEQIDSQDLPNDKPDIQEPLDRQNWNRDIEELEIYFKTIVLPTVPLRLNRWSMITDVPKFIENHIDNVKTNVGKQKFVPYLNRLKELKQLLMDKTDR